MEYSHDKIVAGMFAFKRKTGLEPSIIYLGQDTREKLVTDRKNYKAIQIRSGGLIEFMGMRVVEVMDYEYLEFGVAHDVQ